MKSSLGTGKVSGAVFTRNDLLGVSQAPSQAGLAPHLSREAQHKYLPPLTYSHRPPALPSRHQVSNRPMHRNVLFAGFQQVCFPLSGTPGFCHLWGLCQAEGTCGKCFLLHQRLLKEVASWVAPALQLPHCCLSRLLVEQAGWIRTEALWL